MNHPLDGCRSKIWRAGDHLQALDLESRRYVEDYSYGLVIDEEPEGGEKVIRLRSNRRPHNDPPDRLGVIVGDVLHDLRSALDHLVWQLAIIGSGPKERANQFPIFDTPEKFKEKCPRYLHGIAPEHRTRIEAYQPYMGGSEGFALHILATLNDVDKHRVVHPGAQLGMTPPSALRFSSNIRSAKVRSSDWVRLEDGAEVYRVLEWEHTGGPVEVHADLRYTIVFGDVDSNEATSRADLLIIRNAISNIVESFAGAFGAVP
jgi:hypothetical protein